MGVLLMIEYTCLCGKMFQSSQKFNGHRSQCNVYLQNKYGNDDYIKIRQKHYRDAALRHAKLTMTQREEQKKLRQAEKFKNWLITHPKCEYCGTEMTTYYGSGRFCGIKCARAAATSKNRSVISERVSKTLKSKYPNGNKRKIAYTRRNNEKDTVLQQLLDAGFLYVQYPDIDFGNKYLINNKGVIYSVHLLKELKHNAFAQDGYRRILLTDTLGKQHMIYLHRLVAYMFIPNPDNLPMINHKDENPANNQADNLEWCTCRYNNMYNDAHIRRGKKISETVRNNGGPHNKGKHISEETREKLRKVPHTFQGNQYVDAEGNTMGL